MRILAVADEVVDSLSFGVGVDGVPDLVLGAGDLPFTYLESLADRFDAPCVFVPGNHDRGLAGFRRGRTGWTRAGLPAPDPGPVGAVNADGRTVTVAGVRISGLGGSPRYSDGPNQYSETRQLLRCLSLWGRRPLPWRRPHILLTHAPARGVGDGEDRPHRGFSCFHRLVAHLRPRLMVHGHIHPHGSRPADLVIGADTVSMNVVGYCEFEFDPVTRGVTIIRRRHGA